MEIMKELFELNRSVLDVRRYARLIELETPWIDGLLDRVRPECSAVDNHEEFSTAFKRLVKDETEGPNSSAEWLAEEATTDQFRIVLQEFAIDSLTEAQAFFHIMPRLPLEAQMPILRILIDEFGAGNVQRAHTTLSRKILRELGMSTDYREYYDHIKEESFAFLNIFYWLTQRAPEPDFFLGALTYLETIIPPFFQGYADACARLNIKHDTYYTEHQHIDFYHAKEGQRAILEFAKKGNCDFKEIWAGVLIGSIVTNEAFEGAIAKAKTGAKIVWEKERAA